MKLNVLKQVYSHSLGLLTDLYQLTMAHGYWKTGIHEREAVYHLDFRENPFNSGFSVACGLSTAIEYIKEWRFTPEDLSYLSDFRGNDNKPIFEKKFLNYLQKLHFSCDIDAIPEGTIVFPYEPLLRIKGPIIECQILETPLLNMINFQTLIATKATRICLAAKSDPVLEFGLRRAQGIDGSICASRAAYIGGCAGTSNVLAGKLFGIPVKGTHAHSWVMAFEDEMESFQAYAEAMPNNCIFLVDTYNSLEGVRRAVKVGEHLRQKGYKLIGIRLDSGDLAYLSIEARKILDQANFQDAVIVASNDLDENIIESLKEQGARINVWGVGTRLVTAYDQPALGGIYKLSAIKNQEGKWEYRIKLSEQVAKINNPGILQVRRFHSEKEFIGDMVYDINMGLQDGNVMVDPMDMTRRKFIPMDTPYEELLVPIFREGKQIYEEPGICETREYAKNQLDFFHSGIKRFVNPHRYPVGLEQNLYEVKTSLILKARENGSDIK
ncbi:nicotinate phosphoribosyltransferase [Candidatus Sumerlaeota bacterium]|nr:nicotinate phosphoribosyltransferase [Candidatus Sumerlaeota bacterium]